MLAITQYEVLVLQKGRWTIHARYPGEERKQAVLDARTTESATGFPTKVIRETYFPEANDSERITTYISPKAKAASQPLGGKNRKPLAAARVTNAIANRVRPAVRAARQRLSPAQAFFRVIVAGGISLAAATLTTGVIAWALHRVADIVEITAGTRTTVLTYAYVIMFLLFFWSLFRSRLPLHRLLADLWAKTAKKAEVAAAQTQNAKPPKLKPKHPPTASPEAIREFEDMKLKRGDLDVVTPPEMAEELPEPTAPIATTVPLPPVLEPDRETEEAELAKAKAEAQKQKEAAKLAAKEAQKKAQDEAAKAKQQPAEETPAPESLRDTLNLERMVLRRFAVDVVKPAVMNAMPDDPVSRRGTALVLAGGASGVAVTARLNPAAEVELLNDALQHIGMHQVAIDSFMNQRMQQITSPANATLLEAGRSALAAYLEGAFDVAAVLARALTGWRTPVGQNVLPLPGVTIGEASAVPLLDVYLLTELREEEAPSAASETAIEAFHDQAMGAHNGVVRGAITAHGGHEVKHTGKGIFARFTSARLAVDAAVDMQRNFLGTGSKLAIGIIGNTTAGEDPLLSPNLMHQAQAILARTGPGEILCEAQVQAAIRRQLGPDAAGAEAGEELALVRLSVPEPSFEAAKSQTKSAT